MYLLEEYLTMLGLVTTTLVEGEQLFIGLVGPLHIPDIV